MLVDYCAMLAYLKDSSLSALVLQPSPPFFGWFEIWRASELGLRADLCVIKSGFLKLRHGLSLRRGFPHFHPFKNPISSDSRHRVQNLIAQSQKLPTPSSIFNELESQWSPLDYTIAFSVSIPWLPNAAHGFTKWCYARQPPPNWQAKKPVKPL